MKRFLLALVVLLGSFATARAQEELPEGDDAKKMERLQALYVAFITKELSLNSEDAQKFWPVHAEFDREIKGVPGNLPELERQQRVLDIKKRYQDRFNRVLGSGRTENFFRKDVEFRRKVVEMLKRQKQRRQQGPPPRLRRGA
jgi:hypothetical protein